MKRGQLRVNEFVRVLENSGLRKNVDFFVNKGIPLKSTGQLLRPDVRVLTGPYKGIWEIKGGYVSGSGAKIQARNYHELGMQEGLDVFYILYKGASSPFRQLLGIEPLAPWW